MKIPETRYTKIGDSSIAYQVMGDGPIDLVYVTGFVGNIETQWEFPPLARMLERMASYSRLIMFDRRGQGISDPVSLESLPTWEHWADDLRAVLDAAESERTAILVQHDAGQWGILFAALHPDRTSALIFWNSYARTIKADDYPIGFTAEEGTAMALGLEQVWGTPALAELTDPSFKGEEAANWHAKYSRTSLTPSRAVAQMPYERDIDVRPALAHVRIPTLVLHRSNNMFIAAELGRYLAEQIEGARYVEIPGQDIAMFAEGADEIQDHIEEFLTGARRPVEIDRVLAMVLFTDIVDSTGRAASLGDRKWKDLLTKHDKTAESEIHRLRGKLVNTTGDGIVATFDGPGRAIRCAHALSRALEQDDIEIRAGLHTGEIELRAGGNVGGIAVHIAARVMAEAGPSEVVCSRTVKDLVAGSEFVFEDRGLRALKGVPDEWQRRRYRRDRGPHRVEDHGSSGAGRGGLLAHGEGPRRRVGVRVRRSRRLHAQGRPRRMAAVRRQAVLTFG